MDFLFKHWAPLPRQFPAPFTVQSIGHFPRKRETVRNRFATCNFSFILRGSGVYHRNGRQWPVTAPAVIVQIPGEALEYGPVGRGWWEELFVIYKAEQTRLFISSGLLDPDHPVWTVPAPAVLQRQLRELSRLSHQQTERGCADRVDRLCEAMIMESRMGLRHGGGTDISPAIAKIRGELRKNWNQDVDWTALARRHGLSLSGFRRHWLQETGGPPARYLRTLRLREARSLLVETRLPVGEIARQCGFADPLYFSRHFRKETGVSCLAYRRTHRRPQ